MNLRERIAEFIDAESLLQRGSRVVVGLSGGADSVALLALLRSLGYECTAVHCNFGLRGDEADRDARHAETIASKLGARFILVKFNTKEYAREHNQSIEMACRELRYNEFERIRRETASEAVAVGHHREDNIETMFLNLLRGSGLHGIKGMLPRRGNIIRPLLETPRQDILEYLQRENLAYIVDSSNLENDYKRNRLRNVIIPTIIGEFPDALTTLNRSLRNLRDCDSLYLEMLPERADSLEGVVPTLLHEWIAPYGFNSSQCEKIITSESGAEFYSATHVLTVCPGRKYELCEINTKIPQPKLIVKTYPATDALKPQRGHVYFDAETLGAVDELTLELWHEGDRMRPFGMNGYRMVSDVMADCGISATERRKTWLLKRGDEVLWIVGHRASAHFPITNKTKNITEISIDHENI